MHDHENRPAPRFDHFGDAGTGLFARKIEELRWHLLDGLESCAHSTNGHQLTLREHGGNTTTTTRVQAQSLFVGRIADLRRFRGRDAPRLPASPSLDFDGKSPWPWRDAAYGVKMAAGCL